MNSGKHIETLAPAVTGTILLSFVVLRPSNILGHIRTGTDL